MNLSGSISLYNKLLTFNLVTQNDFIEHKNKKSLLFRIIRNIELLPTIN